MANVSLADIAQVAGLSASTVSRALSDPEKVNAATRDRVLKIARELRYSPGQASRSRTGVLGLIVPDIANPFFPPIVKAIQARAGARGKVVLITDVDEHAADELMRAQTLQTRVDGVILVSPRSPAKRLQELAGSLPVVFVHRRIEGAPSIVMDDSTGLEEAVEHLAALGHRRMAYLNGPRRSWSNDRRQAAVRAACERHDVELVEFGPFEPQMQSGVRAADLVTAAELTAVIAYDDVIALGLIARLHERGMRPGEDISVVGIDDSPMAEVSFPPLTSIKAPGSAAGAMAVDLLLDLVEGMTPDVSSQVIELETGLVVRGSTGLAPDGKR